MRGFALTSVDEKMRGTLGAWQGPLAALGWASRGVKAQRRGAQTWRWVAVAS
jgi:hypothetical protein